MNKNPFKKYFVWSDNDGKHHIFYGDMSDYSEEDLEGLHQISEKDYYLRDFVEIFGNILEDNNFHSITSLGNDIVVSLNKIPNISEKEKLAFMKDFVYNFIKTYHLR